ncbi:MAG: histidine ammonia-lyase [Oscillospiraceae bacterium]
MDKVVLTGKNLTIEDVINVSRKNFKVELSDESLKDVIKSREYVENIVKNEKVVYGITTGFGKFSDVFISKENSELLQKNLIESHTCSMGDPLKEDEVKAILLLRSNALSKGFSGIKPKTLLTLIEMINKNVLPFIPEKGSLGASGDLAPLSMIALALMGEGECYYKGHLMNTQDAFNKADIKPIVLSSKEGLALINGTNVMTGIGALALYDAEMALKQADINSTLTLEALNGITCAFNEKVHIARGQIGQIKTAQNILKLSKNSGYTTKQGQKRIQDAYSLRCIPQIHGASRDAINYIKEKVLIELNAATDNPLIFPDHDEVISGGNFHGQPMALAFDFLAIATAELANVSERRIERLVNPQLNDLPAFLIEDGGLNSGFMIAQYAAASMVSENKIFCHPASVDSIPSSANQEDHVSMGTTAARKIRNVLDNTQKVLAIEAFCAAQAIDFREKTSMGDGTRPVYNIIRETVDFIKQDTIMYTELDKMDKLVKSHKMVKAAENIVGIL